MASNMQRGETMTEELAEDAQGRLIDKQGVEHIPEDIRRNPLLRAALWVGLAWCLLSTAALITWGVEGDWHDFLGAIADTVISWPALLCAWQGIVWKN